MKAVKMTQLQLLTVKDFMSKNVFTAYSHSNVSKAIRIMVDHDIGSVVVIDSEGPRGVFTERDLLNKILARNRRPENTIIMEVMSPLFVAVDPLQTPEEAAKTMASRKSRLMVFEGGNLVGILTATDIVRAIHKLGRSFDLRRVITKRVVAVEPDTPVERVVQDMTLKRIGSILLVKDGVPYGIFTERDLLKKVLGQGLSQRTRVGELASTPLTTAQIGIDGAEAARIMATKRIKRLPLFAGDMLAGIVTARDLVDAFADSAA